MNNNNVGLICPCERAEYYVRHLKKCNFNIKALWTPSFEVTVQFAAEHEIPFAASLPDEVVLRREVEMVIITDRPSAHAQIAVKALGIGKHVLCDSPAALTPTDAFKMVEASQYYPQLLSLVGYGLRQQEIFKKMKSEFQQGYLGRPAIFEITVRCGPLHSPHRYDWLWEYCMGGGVLNVIGSHVIDLIGYLCGRKACRVQGVVRNLRQNSRNLKIENNNFNGESTEDEVESGNSEFVGYVHRNLNADDFSSFLLKFEDCEEITATVTLNSLCEFEFRQEILISGPGGQLKSENFNLFKRLHNENQFQLIYNGDDGINSKRSHSVNSKNSFSIQQNGGGVPEFYSKTFLEVCQNVGKILPLFSSASSIIETNNNTKESEYGNALDLNATSEAAKLRRQRISSARSACEIAGFEDAQYVRAVIDAVRHSSSKGDWVKIEMPSQLENQFV